MNPYILWFGGLLNVGLAYVLSRMGVPSMVIADFTISMILLWMGAAAFVHNRRGI